MKSSGLLAGTILERLRVREARTKRLGSGYDLYARLLARHYGAASCGHPNVIVQNMPGAGSTKAANYLLEVAPRDGTQIGMTGRGTPRRPLLGGKGATFKDDKSFTWIDSMNREVSVCVA